MISAFGKVSRRPATAGNVWTISPRAPRRTTRKRGSGMRRLANGFEEIAGGMILRVANDGDFDAETIGGGSLRNGFGGVVGAFRVNVGAKVFEQRLHTRFAEENHIIDGLQRGHEVGASVLIENGAARAFQFANARVGVDADDEDVALAAGAF